MEFLIGMQFFAHRTDQQTYGQCRDQSAQNFWLQFHWRLNGEEPQRSMLQ
jgi:hypothetical protein